MPEWLASDGQRNLTEITRRHETRLWPRGAKAAVCLTGDVDSSQDLVNDRLERILDVLDDYRVRYTFPITAHVFLEDLDAIKYIIKHGDEIAGHGDIHEFFRGQSHGVQRRRMERMIKMIKEAVGLQIRGFRAPGLKEDIITSKVANELGLLYDSSLGVRETWWINVKGKFVKIEKTSLRSLIVNSMQNEGVKRILKSVTHPLIKRVGLFGEKENKTGYLPFNPIFKKQKLRVLVIPVSVMDDFYLIDRAGIKNWRKIAKIWIRNFDDRYMKNGLYVLLAHPRRIGRVEYVKSLRALIEYATSKNDVWFATLTELAEWWKTRV